MRIECYDVSNLQGTEIVASMVVFEDGLPRKSEYRRFTVRFEGQNDVAAMDELGITGIALCVLAKRLEEVWLPGDVDPVILPRTSEGLYLLQRIRDEAHRFAITHHRSRRTKTMVRSELDDVAGLGPTRRKALLKVFGSVKKNSAPLRWTKSRKCPESVYLRHNP